MTTANETHRQGDIIARSASMERVLDLARRAAISEATVLITGESGTGKERLARHVHELSPRRAGPFVAINCGALPESLLESELFGHAKGAFTGASGQRKGLFAAAGGGTLFLDEIGETSPTMQVRLLRALQERRVRPVGANEEVPVHARVIAATNGDLAAMVSEGSFRKDLFYRLRVVPLEVPPLRERRDDILPLSRHFISRTCAANRCGPCALSANVLDVLHRYSWPGNVRELENAIERAVVLAEGQPDIRVTDLPPEVRGDAAPPTASVPSHSRGRVLTLAEIERQHILATLERFDGHRRKTAEALGIGENTLWRRLKKWRLID
jgi:two-component system response regulator HydG